MPGAVRRRRWARIAAIGLVALTALMSHGRAPRPLHRAAWLEAGDVRLRTISAGTRSPTIVLLHGFGESLFTWRALVDPLATTNRVVAVDLPGQGGSDKPDSGYRLAATTARIMALLDRVSTDPVILVGHSMGGEIAASVALERPDRVAALVLIAPAGWRVGLAGIADTMYPGKARALGWYLSSRAFVLPEHDPGWLAEPDSAAEYTGVGDPRYRASAARILEELDFRALRYRFRDLAPPVLLLWGKLDPVIPYSIADSLAAELRCGRLVTFPTALHRPQVEIPDQVLAEIRKFVAAPLCRPDSFH